MTLESYPSLTPSWAQHPIYQFLQNTVRLPDSV